MRPQRHSLAHVVPEPLRWVKKYLPATAGLDYVMAMTIYLAPLVALLGLLAFALSKNPDVKALALYAWACGLLVTLLDFTGHYRLP